MFHHRLVFYCFVDLIDEKKRAYPYLSSLFLFVLLLFLEPNLNLIEIIKIKAFCKNLRP